MPVRREDNLDLAYAAIVAATRKGLQNAAEQEATKIQRNWREGRDALGRPWTPLSPETIRRKGHSDILIDEGDMFNSVYAESTGPLSAEVGVRSDLIHYHEFGTERIPARPVLEPARIDLKENTMQETVADQIRDALKSIRVAAFFR